MDSSITYWLWLSTRKGLPPQTGLALYHAFGSVQEVYHGTEAAYRPYDLSPQGLQSLLDKNLDIAHTILGDCYQTGMFILPYTDCYYPNKLREILNPPLVLYGKGTMPLVDNTLSITMVGARDATPYGIRNGSEIALGLSQGGAMVLTGMAQGIDSACVEGALKAGKPLISVVAGGIDLCYPKESTHYYHDVATMGVILSEYPPKTRHFGGHFPLRNRILCGLSDGVLIVECKVTGGTMVTAYLALEQQRDLFALTGDIHAPTNRGPHRLIQQHQAYLTTCAKDILDFYQEKYPQSPPIHNPSLHSRVEETLPHIPRKETKARKPSPAKTQEMPTYPVIQRKEQLARFTDDQLMLIRYLGENAQSMDDIVEGSGLTAKRALSAVTMLEMDGALEDVGNGRFRSLVRLASV